MTKITVLKAIQIVSGIGILFSGYLSYFELFWGKCPTCGSAIGLILGLPACVYGLFMYTLIFMFSCVGLSPKKLK